MPCPEEWAESGRRRRERRRRWREDHVGRYRCDRRKSNAGGRPPNGPEFSGAPLLARPLQRVVGRRCSRRASDYLQQWNAAQTLQSTEQAIALVERTCWAKASPTADACSSRKLSLYERQICPT